MVYIAQKWHADKEAMLERLWADQFRTAAVIAAEMGISRNAVLGKAHRMKLPPRRESYTDAVRLGLSPRHAKPKAKPSVTLATGAGNIAIIRPAESLAEQQRKRALAQGYGKSSPSYRATFGLAPEMTANQRRQFLAEAMRNTAAMQAAGS